MIVSGTRATSIRRVVRHVLPWLLLVAVLGNIAMTIRFHSGTSHALRFSASGDLADLIDSTYPEMRQEYGVYAELRRVADGSPIELPGDHPFDLDRLRFLAGMEPREGTWYPVDGVDGLEPEVSAQMWVEDHLVRYSIFAGVDGEPYGLARDGGKLIVAPTRLLDDRGTGG
jgi:hypothetical protein